MSECEHEHRYAEQLLARLREWMRSEEATKARHRSPAREAHYGSILEVARPVLPPGVEHLIPTSTRCSPTRSQGGM